MNTDSIKKVLLLSAICFLVGYGFSVKFNTAYSSDINMLLTAAVSYASVVLVKAYLDKTPEKCFEDKLKMSSKHAVIPTILIFALNHPEVYKFVNTKIPVETLGQPLIIENIPTLTGAALHSVVFALVYFLYLTKLCQQ